MNAKQRFLEQVLRSGHGNGIISASDVLRHVTPDVLAEHLPKDLKAALLTASLSASAMTADLVVDTVGIESLAEHMPMHVLWACIAEAGSGPPTSTSKARATTVPGPNLTSVPKSIAPPPVAGKPASATASLTTAAAKPTSAATKPTSLAASPGKVDTSTKVTPVAPEPEEPASLPAPPVPGGLASPTEGKVSTKSKSRPKATPKPNVRAKPKVDKSNPSKRSTLTTRSEFDVDTDVGEVWESDVEVEEFEIVDEADALGATPLDAGDWQSDEETKAGDGPSVGRKR